MRQVGDRSWTEVGESSWRHEMGCLDRSNQKSSIITTTALAATREDVSLPADQRVGKPSVSRCSIQIVTYFTKPHQDHRLSLHLMVATACPPAPALLSVPCSRHNPQQAVRPHPSSHHRDTQPPTPECPLFPIQRPSLGYQ